MDDDEDDDDNDDEDLVRLLQLVMQSVQFLGGIIDRRTVQPSFRR